MKLLETLKEGYNTILEENLVGIYLYGSYVLSCYNPEFSDLDYIVVVKEPLSTAKKKELLQFTLKKLCSLAPKKGLEFHILLKNDVQDLSYPKYFDFHYSNFHHQECIENQDNYVTTMNGHDEDLATHLMFINKYGRTLIGEPINEVFAEVPEDEFLNSILFDIRSSRKFIIDAPASTILNLCRTLAYVSEKRFLSKKEGGEWALAFAKGVNQEIIRNALANYTKNSPWNFDGTTQSMNFVEDYLNQIEEHLVDSKQKL